MTKKTLSLLALFLIVAGVFNYLYFFKEGSFTTTSENTTEVSSGSLKTKNADGLPQSGKSLTTEDLNENEKKKLLEESEKINNAETLDEKESEKEFQEYDRLETAWIQEVQKVFPKPKMFDVYLVFREDCENEKMQVYEEFHKLMEKKYGKNYSYSLSEDQTKREQLINDKYLKKLKDMLGEKDFMKYLKVRDQFNEEIARNTKGKRPLLIEY